MSTRSGLDAFNTDPGLRAALVELSGSPEWADALVARRPFASEQALFAAAADVLAAQPDGEVRVAVEAHPRIGGRPAAGSSSEREQSAAAHAQVDTARRLVELNDAYEKRFGHVCLIRADGLSAEQVVDAMSARLANDPDTEWRLVREHLGAINALRLRRLLDEHK
ncbi:2-oxo-4-hydroxy-4-carboxy-5-ureidoimidazoline decarboxylase [Rhodococcus sp. HNM0569]|uniref:2-oxo-4-hydroxy-4-carboxy-5-ureidoimidazoline decarboxylase n=1 Tax=Rhodococcus sp. HNM0569 TaxID=2716340 RepID=UPI00146E687E|nr:2-oxo-4-hydroxy-4-carboxy-5-ureidoimidazoline decarboxylase [Rhodococcus sp. HNM0569]NLU82468.1 2-oxo-4-hydroxy-4-carboxy-5-ureidoimidazoline decarboxylase [Rhodococcus sp. HNM0569]